MTFTVLCVTSLQHTPPRSTDDVLVQIADTYKDEDIPEFPSRSVFSAKLSLAESRVPLLDKYFQNLTASPTVVNSSALWALLEVRKHVVREE